MLKVGDHVWIEFECFADWEDLSESISIEQSVLPLKADRQNFEYAFVGEVFHLEEPGRTSDMYINPGVPIMLTLGLPADPRKPRVVHDGKTMTLSRGRLYGQIEK